MGPDKEPFIIWVGCVTLNGWRLVKDLPVLSVFQTSFHEKSIYIGWKVTTAYDLAYEVDLCLKVSHLSASILSYRACSQLSIQSLT
jgi:hypothetical protein